MSGPYLEIDVADQGPGIPHADRAHIFDPFYQGTQAVHALVKGTGIVVEGIHENPLIRKMLERFSRA